MDIDTLRIAVTVISFFTFIGIFLWAYSSGARAGFAEAAQLPFLDEPFPHKEGHQLGDEKGQR